MADDGVDLGDVFQAAVAIAVAYAAQSALNSLTQGKQQAVSQSVASKVSTSPAHIRVGGLSRGPGLQVFHEVNGNWLTSIQAMHHGRTPDPAGYYLNDDRVGVDGLGFVTSVYSGTTAITDGRYIDQKVRLFHRNGAATETAYSEIVARYGSLWTNNHRGDGISSVAVVFEAPKAKFIPQAFPSGEPNLSVVTRPADIYDWRQDSTQVGGSGTQRRNDPTTWGISDNPVVNRVHLEWFRWGRNWDRCIAPVLANLTAETNKCDELVPLAAGGTEKRYTCAGWYVDDTNRDDVRKKLDAAMDGFCTTDGRGRLIIKCGHYEEPTFVLTQEYIEDYTWSRGVSRDVRVSSLAITFTHPDSDYNTVSCDPWVIDENGGKASPLALDWVTSWTQARRLGKRAAAKANPAYTGQIKTGPYGFNGMGQRYIRVQNPVESSMADVVCEVTNVEFDPISGQVVFDVIQADPNIDGWVPAAEEGTPVTAAATADPGLLTTPTIDSIVPYYDGNTVRLQVTTTGPDRDDLTWFSHWRVQGATAWNDPFEGDEVAISGGQVYFNTSAVTPSTNLEVQVEYRTGGGTTSAWSPTFTINSSVIPPSWADSGALWQAELTSTSNRFWTGDTTYASLAAATTASKASFSRSGSKLAAAATGTYSTFATGVIAMTDKGASLEPASTSLAGNSDTLSNGGWTASGATKTAGQTTPFGSDGASILNAGTAVHSFGHPSLTYTAGQIYTAVIYMPAGTVTRYQLTFPSGSFGTSQYANFLLTGSGSITFQTGLLDASIKLENGYYILSISMQAITTASGQRPALCTIQTGTDARQPSYASTDTWLVHRGEIISGQGYGTPIISTSGSVTRNADALVLKPLPGTYTVKTTYSDGSVTTQTGVVITTSGYTVPTKLNGYVTKVVGS